MHFIMKLWVSVYFLHVGVNHEQEVDFLSMFPKCARKKKQHIVVFGSLSQKSLRLHEDLVLY